MFKKGFTLLEVLIVVIIIGILAAIALPQYTATLEKGRSGEALTNIGSIRTSLDRYWYQNGSLPAASTFTSLDIDNPNSITTANRLWNYYFDPTGTTSTTRIYTVTAYRNRAGTEDINYWVKWIQSDNNTGKITRSANLGGPTS